MKPPPRFGLGDISQVDSIPFSPSSLTLHFHPLQFVRRFLRVLALHSAAPSSLRKQSSHGRIGYRGVAQSWSPACHDRASTRVLKIELFRFPVQWNCRSRLLIDRNPLRLCQPLPIRTRLSPNWDFERLNRLDTRNHCRIILVNGQIINVYRHTTSNPDKINWEELEPVLPCLPVEVEFIVISRVVRERCNFIIKKK